MGELNKMIKVKGDSAMVVLMTSVQLSINFSLYNMQALDQNTHKLYLYSQFSKGYKKNEGAGDTHLFKFYLEYFMNFLRYINSETEFAVIDR